jgi:AAA15 family ATPase/GTPase
MSNFLNQLEIKNFKSIKHLQTDCKRVNVFIGKPNVGKSNILEALGVFNIRYDRNTEKILNKFIRYQEISNFFYDDDLQNTIEINTDKTQAVMRFRTNITNEANLMIGDGEWVNELMKMEDEIQMINEFRNIENKSFTLSGYNKPYFISIFPDGRSTRGVQDLATSFDMPIKKYHFKALSDISNKFPDYLLPPYGDNLFTIIDHDKELRKEIAEIFSEYGLQFVAYKKESKFEIEKNIDGYVNKYHYASMADTFQRLFFYFAVIDSNKDAVLVLEEPEVHSFPPYTKELSERIIASTENQFFITTHSPYLLQNLISNLEDEELNVFITYYENYQTKIKKLTSEELRNVSAFGVDLFYNLNEFIPHA